MKIDDLLMERLFQMACLDLPDKGYGALKEELERVATWVEQLRAVNVEGMSPMLTPSEEVSCLRPDEPQEPLPVEELLQQAPDRSGHYFTVPW